MYWKVRTCGAGNPRSKHHRDLYFSTFVCHSACQIAIAAPQYPGILQNVIFKSKPSPETFSNEKTLSASTDTICRPSLCLDCFGGNSLRFGFNRFHSDNTIFQNRFERKCRQETQKFWQNDEASKCNDTCQSMQHLQDCFEGISLRFGPNCSVTAIEAFQNRFGRKSVIEITNIRIFWSQLSARGCQY